MSENHHHPSHPPEDEGVPSPTMGSHRMLIVGEKSTFLSHLPMFMFDTENHPHNFQVILRVTFERRAKRRSERNRDQRLAVGLQLTAACGRARAGAGRATSTTNGRQIASDDPRHCHPATRPPSPAAGVSRS